MLISWRMNITQITVTYEGGRRGAIMDKNFSSLNFELNSFHQTNTIFLTQYYVDSPKKTKFLVCLNNKKADFYFYFLEDKKRHIS